MQGSVPEADAYTAQIQCKNRTKWDDHTNISYTFYTYQSNKKAFNWDFKIAKEGEDIFAGFTCSRSLELLRFCWCNLVWPFGLDQILFGRGLFTLETSIKCHVINLSLNSIILRAYSSNYDYCFPLRRTTDFFGQRSKFRVTAAHWKLESTAPCFA